MNDEALKEELRMLGGVPEEVLQDKDLYEFFSPIMRADFEVLEKDNFSEKGIVINTPIHAIMGTKEERNSKIENWKNFTSSDFAYQLIEGGHFFIQDHPKEMATIIKSFFKKGILL